MSETDTQAKAPEVLLDMIRANFPELQWERHKVVTEGWDHVIIILDGKWVFRFPIEPDYAGQLKNEVLILERLRPLVKTVRIPEYCFVPERVDFAGYNIVPGKPLEKSYFDTLAPADHTAIARQLAGLLTAMHTAIADGHDFSLVPAAYMADDQKEVKQHAETYLPGKLPEDELRLVHEILARVDTAIATPHPDVFIHADIYNRHMLWDDSAKQLGVIDFSDMNRGDPAIDFAELHEYGRDFVNEVYAHYAGPKDDTLLERAWVYQQWAAVYMLTDHFINDKTSWKEARHTFEWVKARLAAEAGN